MSDARQWERSRFRRDDRLCAGRGNGWTNEQGETVCPESGRIEPAVGNDLELAARLSRFEMNSLQREYIACLGLVSCLPGNHFVQDFARHGCAHELAAEFDRRCDREYFPVLFEFIQGIRQLVFTDFANVPVVPWARIAFHRPTDSVLSLP